MGPKVIKGEAPVSSSAAGTPALSDRKVIDREIYKAQQRSEQIKQEAEQEAEDARAEGARQAQAAYDEAYQVGAAEGMVAAACRAVDGYYRRGEALREAVSDCVTIGRHICQKIVGRPLKLGDVECRNIALEILTRAIERRQLSILFADSDWQEIERDRPLLLNAFRRYPEFTLDSDAGRQPGLVYLQLQDGDFNAPLGGVLQALAELFDVGEEAGPAPGPSADALADEPMPEEEPEPIEDPFAAPELQEELEADEDSAVAAPHATAAGRRQRIDADPDTGQELVGDDSYEDYEDEVEYEDAGDADEDGDLGEDLGLPEEGSTGFNEEQVGYHDISELIAEIDAEDDEG